MVHCIFCNTFYVTTLYKADSFEEVHEVLSEDGKGKGKGRFIGLFQHCGRSAYCVLTLNKFPHSSPEAPRIIQMRENSTREGGNYYQ